MKVKVIKAFKGLEVGDVLTFDKDEYRYELTKVNEDISETNITTTKKLYTFSEWVIKSNPDYFEFIDDEGTKVDVVEQVGDEKNYKMSFEHLEEAVDAKQKKIEELETKVKSLEGDIMSMANKLITYKALADSHRGNFYGYSTPRFWAF